MSNMKSKLAASVRQVKAQAPVRAPVKPAPEKKAPVKMQKSPVPTITAGQPQATGSTLFPSRVWPD